MKNIYSIRLKKYKIKDFENKNKKFWKLKTTLYINIDIKLNEDCKSFKMR